MTDQDKFELIADAFLQNFITWNPSSNILSFRCSRTSLECAPCTLNGSNYDEPGICLGRKVLNNTTLASEFFDQYPEYLI